MYSEINEERRGIFESDQRERERSDEERIEKEGNEQWVTLRLEKCIYWTEN